MTDAAMNESAAAALRAMSSCIAREMAQHWARLAADRGATPAELADAWASWDTAQDGATPTGVGR